jgi:uncharacterized GH25 family protein
MCIRLLKGILNQHRLCFGLAALISFPAFSHEFWIEPTQYQIEKDGVVEAYLRNGEYFTGSASVYLPSRTPRFELLTTGRADPVVARLGDNPALKMQALQAGLNIVVHQSDTSVISYNNWDKFQRFADHKDFPDVLTRHLARSLPQDRFREAYSRYSKSLVAVGGGEGEDRFTGLDIELVALQNPYVDDLREGITIKAYYLNEARANAQIELYEKARDDEVSVTVHRTNDQGMVVLPVKPAHRYLVDMVVLREPSKRLALGKSVVWETLWASLTFAVP